MIFDHDKFMNGVGLYEEANRRRDNLEFDFAFSLYEQAQEFLYGRVDVPLFYDMAIAADLSGDLRKASEYFDRSSLCLEQMKAENPHDERIKNLQPLVDSLAHQMNLRSMVGNDAADYASQVEHKVWLHHKFPLTIWIADRANQNDGFAKSDCDLIYHCFEKWVQHCQWFQIARASNFDENAARVVIKQASAGDLQLGSGGQTNFLFSNAGELERVDIRVYIPSSNLQSLILHEAGHALGIDGHSPYSDDLMWWKSPLINISNRDVETMKIIYGQ